MPNQFALFVDVMGIQQQLDPVPTADAEARFNACQERLADFHQDLASTIDQDQLLLTRTVPLASPLSFVAEFSDAAYLVSNGFAAVASAGIVMMRKAIRHGYPLRGGLGVGTFSHETSGVRTGRDGLVWGTSSFLGGAVVTAYQAERCSTPGLRIFVREGVMRRNTEPLLKPYTVSLLPEEAVDNCTHELRLWSAAEAGAAQKRLEALRDSQEMTPKARRHYDAAGHAYRRFEVIRADLPIILPAVWLWGQSG